MKITPDDPQLTAYALGELDETERIAVEAALQDSPEGRAALDEIRQAAVLLAKVLEAEVLLETAPSGQGGKDGQFRSAAPPPEPEMTEAGPAPGKVVRFPWQRFLVWGSLAAAACFLVLLQLPDRFAPAAVPWSDVGLDASDPQAQFAAPVMDAESLPLAETSRANSPSATPPAAAVSNPVVTAPANESESLPVSQANSGSSGLYPRLSKRLSVPTSRDQAQPAPQSLPKPAQGPQSRSLSSQLGRSDGLDLRPSSVAPQINAADPLASVSASGAQAGANGRDRSLFVPGSVPNRSKVRSESSNELLRRRFIAPPPLGEARLAEIEDYIHIERFGESLHKYRSEPVPARPAASTASYPRYVENGFESVLQNPLSTFSADVDTASYANVRRFLRK